jgi:hypothetical protein
VFEKLVPAGRGRLIIQRKTDRATRLDDDLDSDDEYRLGVEMLTLLSTTQLLDTLLIVVLAIKAHTDAGLTRVPQRVREACSRRSWSSYHSKKDRPCYTT